MKTTPIFTKVFDFISWLVPKAKDFPKSQRFVVTKRLLDAALDMMEFLVAANSLRGKERARQLAFADIELDKVRIYLRMIYRWQWISQAQYGHAAKYVTEIGRLLGGWKKKTRQS